MKKKVTVIAITTLLATVGISTNTLAVENIPDVEQSLLNSTNIDNSFVEILADESIKEKRFFDKLDLSNSQKQKWQNIQTKYRPEILNLRKQLRNEQTQLRKMMQDNASESQLRNQQQNVWQLSEKIQNVRFDATLEMRQILTREQLTIWAESRQEAELKANRRYRFVPK